jgi:hypothetical protein
MSIGHDRKIWEARLTVTSRAILTFSMEIRCCSTDSGALAVAISFLGASAMSAGCDAAAGPPAPQPCKHILLTKVETTGGPALHPVS